MILVAPVKSAESLANPPSTAHGQSAWPGQTHGVFGNCYNPFR